MGCEGVGKVVVKGRWWGRAGGKVVEGGGRWWGRAGGNGVVVGSVWQKVRPTARVFKS